MRGLLLPVFGILAGLMLAGCQREGRVYAGSDAYQPRPAPIRKRPLKEDLHGELLRVDLPKNIFVVRVENGMEQTFKFNDGTVVMGLEESPSVMRNLVGKEGSELIVQWQEDDTGAKTANRVDVTQVITSKNITSKNVRRRRK